MRPTQSGGSWSWTPAAAAHARAIAASEIIVRLDERERELVGALDLAARQTAFAHHRGSVTRLDDVVRCGAIRLNEASALGFLR